MSKDPLLQPFQIRHLRLRNRILITSHEPAYAEDGLPKSRYRAYHVERAKAGVALTMTAGSASVSRDSPPAFNNILAWKDEVVPHMRDLVDACHDHGAAVMIQLTHLGRRTRWDKGDWLPVLGASPAREPAHRAFPKRIEDWDIARVIRDYADAAERMAEAGCDGVEFECYGHLMDQFISPLTNDLPAPWGGTLDNRLRFAFDVLRAVRARVGDRLLIGMRYVGDEMTPGGTTEGVEIGKRFKASGMVDFLNIIRGRIDTDAALTDVIPIQGMAAAPHLDYAGEIRRQVDFPTFHAARIPDLATARHAVASGLVDMVGMTRAHLADPHLIAKLIAGREGDIRPCVGATYCLDRIYQGGAAYCIHNAATGREETMPQTIAPAARARKVVVVGAGPGGLEAARVAGARGHKVTVFEAAPQPGGQVRLTALSPRKREMQGIVDWRMQQCSKYDVSLKFNIMADVSDVLDEDPDVVVIATGGLPRSDILTHGNDLVVTAWDILAGDVRPGTNVLLFDDAGDHAAMQAAEVIAATGARLEIMTPDRSFAPEIMGMNLVPYMRALQRKDVTFTVTWRLLAARRDGNLIEATIGSDYIPDTRTARYDQIVVNHGTLPLEDLYFDLKARSENLGAVEYGALVSGQPQPAGPNPDGRFRLYRIGDAVSARNTHAAIYDALRLMKDI